jgi:hypothetical protein
MATKKRKTARKKRTGKKLVTKGKKKSVSKKKRARRRKKEEVVGRVNDPTAFDVPGRFEDAMRRYNIWPYASPPRRGYRPFSCLEGMLDVDQPVRIGDRVYNRTHGYLLARQCRGE